MLLKDPVNTIGGIGQSICDTADEKGAGNAAEDAGDFNNSLEGFENFTKQAERVIDEATVNGNVRNINGKSIYYIDGVANPKKGVVVIVREGKIQSMMPSDFKSFNKLQ